MAVFTNAPSGDWRNDGWSLVGSGVTALWQALSAVGDDSKYVKCPASQGQATVTFPIDVSTVPDGAVITSVTVNLRCSTGTGSPPSGTPASITVATACTDDTSRYTTRTIYPTSTITTIPVATYQRDALGFIWDIERLNKLLCRVWCYVGILDLVRCHEFYCTVNYRLRPTITVDQPTGTVLTPSPTISWTYTQSDGDPQTKAHYKVFTAVQQAAVSFDPQTASPVFDAVVAGDIHSVTLPTSINPDTYWVYVRATSSFGAKSLWVGRQFTVSGPAPGTPGTDDPTGTVLPGTGVISVVPDSINGSATLTLRDTSNMLSVQAADAETNTDGESLNTTNCAVVRDNSTAFPGGASSWKMTASSSADMSLTTNWVEVSPSVPVTARAQFITAASAKSCRVRVLFWDATFASVAGTLTGSNITDATGTWTEAVVTGTTPAGAVYAQVACDVLSATNATVHNVDHIGLMYGTSTPWSPGGHMSRNLLSAWYATAEGTAGAGEAWTAGTATSTTTASPPGTGGSGSLCNSMTYLGLTPSLALRAAGTVFTSPTSGANYTLNKPAGTTTGDLMLAFVSSSEFGTITPPAGWTVVNTAVVDDGSTDTALYVLKRTAGGAEPSTWTDGTLSVNSLRRHAVVVGYAGAADASLQFVAEGQAATSNNQPAFITSPTLNNTDPNAWRVSAFAVNDDATGGTMVGNIQQPSTIPAILFVGRATAWKDTSGGTSYVINRPTGVASGDLMTATVGIAGNVTVTAPTGWTIVRQTVAASGPYTHAVLKRTAGGSEPASWTGSVSGSLNHPKVTQCVAHRNCADASLQYLAENITSSGGAQSISTPTVTNTNSLAWRITSFGAYAANTDSWTSNDTSERCDDTSVYSTGGWFGYGATYTSVTTQMGDSNGSVGTGTYGKTGTLNESYYGAAAWIGIIKPLGSPPTPVSNETQRAQTNVGSSTPWLATGVFDSNGVIPTGNTSVTGIFTPGDADSAWSSAAAWAGIIRPATPVRQGYAVATMATTVDITSIDSSVPVLAGAQATVTAAFIGSAAGTPYLTANFYRANVLLLASVAQGNSFGTGTWVKSAATFNVPAGTTRMSVGVSAADRNVSDITYWDRASLALGGDTVWRSGTSRAAHPVWAKPIIEYADDDGSGYTPWQVLPGQVAQPPSYDALSGVATYVDHTVVPLTNRKYRAKTVSYGLAGDQFVSGYSPDSSEFSFVAENWWLKDISNPAANLLLKVKWDDVGVGTTNTTTVFQPLGEDLAVVLTEGYKSDTFDLNLIPVNHTDWVNLRLLLKSGRTLFLQSDIDQGWWVRPIGDLQTVIIPSSSRQSNPQRAIKVTFVQVAATL